jgi:chromosome segregation ATPase
MPTKFEEAIAAAKTAHYEQPDVLQLIDVIVQQNERIKNLEHFELEAKSRMNATETTVADHDRSIGSLARSRGEHETRLKAAEEKPAADTKRIDELDKRVTTVEGAVGSKAYKRIENKEAKVEPVKTNGVVAEPAPDAPKHFWDPPAAPAAPVAP